MVKPTEEADQETPGPFTPKRIPAEQAQEIAAQGQRLAHEIDFLIRKEERHVKIVSKCREDRKAKTRDLIGLWGDAKAGQQRLDLKAPTNGEADAGAPLSPGHAEKAAYVLGWGEHALRVETYEPGVWVGYMDGLEVAAERSAADAVKAVCDFLELPAKSETRKAAEWGGAASSPASRTARHVAFYKGRSMAVTKQDGSPWEVECRTGTRVAATSGKSFDTEAEAKEHALAMAGYDAKDKRPGWYSASRLTAEASAAASHAKVGENVPAIVERAEIAGHRLDVWTDAQGKARATVDGSFGGEHASVNGAKKWAVERATGKKPKKGDGVVWEPIDGARAFPEAEPLGRVYSLKVGSLYAELRQTDPGRWTGKVDGSPVAIGLQRRDAMAEIEKFLKVEDPTKAVWISTDPFLDAPVGAPAG